MAFSEPIGVSTKSRVEIVDITGDASAIVKKSGVKNGIALVSVPHTTAAVLVNENEPGLLSDITRELQNIIDWQAPYEHNRIDDNAPSHITAAFLGPSIALPVIAGRLSLGTWQSVFFVELDGPRNRRAVVTVMGD